MLKKLICIVIVVSVTSQVPVALCADQTKVGTATTASNDFSPITLDEQDFEPSGGSLVEGLHNGVIYAVMLGPDFYALLNPDSWSSPAEPKAWEKWVSRFGEVLFSKWKDSSTVAGQQTIKLKIYPNKTFTLAYSGQVLKGKANAMPITQKVFGVLVEKDRKKFESELQSAIEGALAAAPPLPALGNPLVDLSFYLTVAADSEMFPRYGAPGFGCVTVINSQRHNITYYADHATGGIQIINDGDGGSIMVGPFDVKEIYNKARAGKVLD